MLTALPAKVNIITIAHVLMSQIDTGLAAGMEFSATTVVDKIDSNKGTIFVLHIEQLWVVTLDSPLTNLKF